MSGADVLLEDPSATVEAVATSVIGFLGETTTGPTLEPVLVTAVADFTTAFGDSSEATGHLATAVHGFFQNGGTRCYVVNVGPPGAEGDERTSRFAAGLKCLESSPDVALLAAPGVTSAEIHEVILAHCEQRRDRFAILDVPDAAEVGQNPVRPRQSTYGACYLPWIEVHDPGRGNVFVPPSGHVAGVYARVDQERGVQAAPANEVVRGALNLRFAVSKRDREILDAQGINCIMTIQHGIRIWGARSLANDAVFRDVQARRVAILVESSIERGIGWALALPPDQKLEARLTTTISSFLQRLHRDGALLGDRPQEAFYVKCQVTREPQARPVVEVGIALARPGDFVVLRMK
jgi:phage tail sheath protein FI